MWDEAAKLGAHFAVLVRYVVTSSCNSTVLTSPQRLTSYACENQNR